MTLWDRFQTWDEAEAAWEAASKQAALVHPMRQAALPLTPAIAPGEHGLRWKGLWWVLKKDRGFLLVRQLLRHPFRHLFQFLRSARPFNEEDLFYYGMKGSDEMKELMQREDAVLVVGFSYCQKPHECPSGRFSDKCLASLDNPVCCQCIIGKARHALPGEKTIFTIIPTINDIGKTVLEAVTANPGKRVLFVITACEMALRMFGDMGNMVGVQGVGIRLGGRVCNTFRAFMLSEEGVKPGATVILPSTQRLLFDLLRAWREKSPRPQGR